MARVPVTFTVAGTQRFSLRPDELSVAPRWAEAVEARPGARATGMDVIRGFRRLALRFSPVDVKPKVSAYDAAVNYEIGLIAGKVDQAEPARAPRPSRAEADASSRARRGAGSTGPRRQGADPRRRSRASPAAARSSCRRSVDQPSVSASRPGNGAGSGPSRRLSAPVNVVVGKRHFQLTPKQLAPMLQLPTTKGGSLVLGGAAANAYFARLDAIVGQPAHGARFSAYGDHVSVIPQQPGVGLDVPALGRRRCSPRRSRATARTAQLAITSVTVGRSTATAKAMGITGVVSSYETFYGGIANRIHNVAARRAPDRRQADRARRDVLVQPGDRRPHRGQGLPRGARDHQRRALDRARRRRLPGVDDGLQRGVRGRPADHRAHEPRALHLPLPDSAATRRSTTPTST